MNFAYSSSVIFLVSLVLLWLKQQYRNWSY